jgi:hypothetical protein
MPDSTTKTLNPALLPSPALFDVTKVAKDTREGRIVRVELEQIELAPNARRDISEDGIDRLAAMLMRSGQLVPCIGHRTSRNGPVILYAGQRRLLAARRSHELCGSEGFEGLEPVRSLIVLLLPHAPSPDEIRRIQAQENAREELSLVDQQAQFADCWEARAGLGEEDRIAAVCADLGISARKAHNLKRQLTLPEEIRIRVAERPAGDQLSVTMANQLAAMHAISPTLTEAVAGRIGTGELHDKALKDLGAFVHRTVVEDEYAYAVRIDDGVLLDAHEQIQRARPHLTAPAQAQLNALLGCEPDTLETELDTLAARAKSKAAKIRITGEIRDRARTGRYAYVHERGQDFADSIWVIDPVFMIDLAREQLEADSDYTPAREEAYFGTSKLADEEMRTAGEEDAKRRQAERARQHEAERSNLGLGHDIAAKLMDPTADQLQALKAIVCRLLAAHYREVIAYGAGWTDRERQQPVGDSSRYEPRHTDAIVDAELQRALDERDPLRGITQLAARWAAAFVLNPDGVTRTKTLGSERMARKLQDALPGGENPLRGAVWEFMRPFLSPNLAQLNRDAFVLEEPQHSTVRLEQHRGDSNLDELDLGEENAAA